MNYSHTEYMRPPVRQHKSHESKALGRVPFALGTVVVNLQPTGWITLRNRL